MASKQNNPISQLMNVDLPEIKRANWNCDHAIAMTADCCYVTPVMTDMILPHTRVKLDIDQSSFANPTVSPLYGRYRVKYLAFWAPHRLYMKEWRNNDHFDVSQLESKYKYPIVPVPSWAPEDTDATTGNGSPYIPPTSLAAYLGLYPGYFQSCDWLNSDLPKSSVAFPFLAYWDIYRNYIVNEQEPTFPIRTRAFKEGGLVINGNQVTTPQPAYDTMVSVSDLDLFFTSILSKSTIQNVDVIAEWKLNVSVFDPLFAKKDVVMLTNTSKRIPYVRHEHHYGLAIAPYLADPNTSWLDNDLVELERTSSSMTAQLNDKGEYQIAMDQWRVASAIQQKMRRYLYRLGDFSDAVDSQYGIRPSTSISKPMFLGAFMSDIVFNDVVSTAQTGDDGIVESNTNLGSRAGYGRGTDREKRSFIDFTAEEPGTLMILQIIQPEVFYCEGRNYQFLCDSYDKEFNPAWNIGLLQDLSTDQLNLVPNLAVNPTGAGVASQSSWSEYNFSIGKQPLAMQHITKTNQAKGMFAMNGGYRDYLLIHSFNGSRDVDGGVQSPVRGWYSSYPFPEQYHNIFANTQNLDNFQFYLNFDYTKYNVVLKKFIPLG